VSRAELGNVLVRCLYCEVFAVAMYKTGNVVCRRQDATRYVWHLHSCHTAHQDNITIDLRKMCCEDRIYITCVSPDIVKSGKLLC